MKNFKIGTLVTITDATKLGNNTYTEKHINDCIPCLDLNSVIIEHNYNTNTHRDNYDTRFEIAVVLIKMKPAITRKLNKGDTGIPVTPIWDSNNSFVRFQIRKEFLIKK